ncbi:hypothetical protein TWF730_002509 [Orbilia blumenaviensis]|uniref:F-box domain-containing protein n=1 Tax=Orbilia blumenaviensis TaxID=1796055 RepID=A0AAV9UCD4_9PEZI
MPPQTKLGPVLYTLPYDIIHEICAYLPEIDFQSLKLVCKSLLSNLPATRLNQCQKTVFFLRQEIDQLKILASGTREQRNRVSRIIFDVTSPYVRLLNTANVDKLIQKYPKFARLLAASGGWFTRETRFKLLRFCLNHRSANENQTRNNNNNGASAGASTSNNPSSDSSRKPQFKGNLSTQLFSILDSFPSPRNSSGQPTQIDYPNHDVFFQALAETFKVLPNLRTLEVRSNTAETASKLTTFWKRYNPNIKAFFLENPELERLPWQDWFEVILPRRIMFDQAYIGLLSAVAKAQCPISEVKINTANILPGDDGSISLHTRMVLSGPEANYYTKLYDQAFSNLTRLEIPITLWECYGGGFRENETPSPVYLALLRNVEELVITRMPVLSIYRQNHGREWQVHSDFFVPGDLVLPRLRRLEIIEIGIIEPFLQFLKTNNASLRELVCISTFNQRVMRVEMIEMLTFMKQELNLEYCRIDFLTNKDIGKLCYLCVEGEGALGDDEGCKYRVGTKCESQPKPWRSEVAEKRDREPGGPGWTNRKSWEGFIAGIEEIGTSGLCKQHWDGDLKPAPSLLDYGVI